MRSEVWLGDFADGVAVFVGDDAFGGDFIGFLPFSKPIQAMFLQLFSPYIHLEFILQIALTLTTL